MSTYNVMQIRLCIRAYGTKSNDKIRIHKYFLVRIIPECEILCDKVHEIFTQAYDLTYI